MLDYTQVLMTLHKFQNFLIPELPKILTDYIIKHEEHYSLFLEKRFNADDMLIYLAKHFIKDEEINEGFILQLILQYFNISNKESPNA